MNVQNEKLSFLISVDGVDGISDTGSVSRLNGEAQTVVEIAAYLRLFRREIPFTSAFTSGPCR